MVKPRSSLLPLFALVLVVVASPFVRAEESHPVMLSLLNPVQWPSSQSDVGGFRLSLLYVFLVHPSTKEPIDINEIGIVF